MRGCRSTGRVVAVLQDVGEDAGVQARAADLVQQWVREAEILAVVRAQVLVDEREARPEQRRRGARTADRLPRGRVAGQAVLRCAEDREPGGDVGEHRYVGHRPPAAAYGAVLVARPAEAGAEAATPADVGANAGVVPDDLTADRVVRVEEQLRAADACRVGRRRRVVDPEPVQWEPARTWTVSGSRIAAGGQERDAARRGHRERVLDHVMPLAPMSPTTLRSHCPSEAEITCGLCPGSGAERSSPRAYRARRTVDS